MLGAWYERTARGPLNFYAIHGKIIATGSGIPPSPVPLAVRSYQAPSMLSKVTLRKALRNYSGIK